MMLNPTRLIGVGTYILGYAYTGNVWPEIWKYTLLGFAISMYQARQGVSSTLFTQEVSFSELLGSKKMSRKSWFVDTACPCE